MKNILQKELQLTASPLSYFFILFAMMTMLPGYPILVGGFFVCLGIFHSFQTGRENNDILFTVLLPVEKSDAVRAKYVFTVFIQMVSFLISFILTLVRMIAFSHAPIFTKNAMMNANQAYLAWLLILFTIFNLVFLCGFFKTAYGFGKPFVLFCILAFVWIALTETLHHFPGLTWLNDTDTRASAPHWMLFAAALIIYILVTLASCRRSIRLFEQVDL